MALRAQWSSDMDRFADFEQLTQRTFFESGQGLPGRVWLSGRQEYISDVRLCPPTVFQRAQAAANAGMQTWFAFPIGIANRVQAVIAVGAARSIGPHEAAITQLSALADDLALLVANLFRLNAKRLHNTIVQSLFNRHPLPIWICMKTTWEVREVNRAAVRILNCERHRQLGLSVVNLMVSSERETFALELEKIGDQPRHLGVYHLEGPEKANVVRGLRAFDVTWNAHQCIILIGDNPRNEAEDEAGTAIHERPIVERLAELTNREREVLDAILQGLTTKEVGRLLQLSPRTVDVYRGNIYRKFGVTSSKSLFVLLSDLHQLSELIRG